MKLLARLISGLIITFSSVVYSNEIDMSGIWTGQTVTGEKTRKVYSVRTDDGFYASRHEYYVNGEMIRWILNYGLWGQTDKTYWTEILVYASEQNFRTIHNCDAPKFTYQLNSQDGDKVFYTSDRDNIQYEMNRLTQLPVDFINQQPVRHNIALEAINTFKQKCRKSA